MKPTTIWVKPAGGAWESLGVGTRRGVWAEDVVLEADRGLSKRATFNLLRDSRRPWPDLLAATPVRVEVAGRPVWKGRVADTPARLGGGRDGLAVECDGVQAQLDDDQYERKYVVTDLSAWQDRRAHLSSTLGSGAQCASGQVSNDGGLTLMFPKDTTLASGDECGVMLDMGPGQTAARIVYQGTSSANNNGTPQVQFFLYAGDDPSGAGAIALVGPQALTTIGATFGPTGVNTGGKRYLFLVLHWNAAGNVANDAWIKFTSVQVFADTAYESGSSSVLKIDQIAKDAKSRATALLAADESRIAAGAFSIPEFAGDGPRTPRQMIEAANAFEDMQLGVDVDDRLVLRAWPTVPEVTVLPTSAVEFEDTSAGSLGEIYSHVLVSGQAPDGTPVRVLRTQVQQPGSTPEPVSSPAFRNPSFASNATYWTASGGSVITRTGGSVGQWDTGSGGSLGVDDTLDAELTGTFEAGRTYLICLVAQATSGGLLLSGDIVEDPAPGAVVPITAPTSPGIITVSFTPSATRSGATLRLTALTSAGYLLLDEGTVQTAVPTIVDRQGFKRTHNLDASFKLTNGSGQQLGDKFLQAHRTTPFAGKLKVTGSLPDYRTGIPVGAEQLLLKAGGLIHFADRVNPDSGAFGRDGRAVGVTYRPEIDEAQIDIDNARGDFEALLERIGLVIGQGTR